MFKRRGNVTVSLIYGCLVNRSFFENLFNESRVEQELLQAEHLANVGLVGVVENRELTEVSLLLFGLLGQDVALVSVLSLDLS